MPILHSRRIGRPVSWISCELWNSKRKPQQARSWKDRIKVPHMGRPRVLLADDHALLLGAFEKLLAEECDIVGQASDGRALVAAAEQLKPDLIILDISMPLLNGLEAGRQIKQKWPNVKLVFLTMMEDADLAAEAFRSGASGYLLKRSAASELTVAIREVMLGRSYVRRLSPRGWLDR